MFDDDLLKHAETTLAAARARGLKIAVAESCTGGLLAGVFTEIAGSSDVFERGFVTYSNQAKTEMLGVPAALIEQAGAVSEQVALAMAEGALAHSPADLVVSITGIAGPTGGTPEKPVGLVHFAVGRRGGAIRHAVHMFGELGRDSIRLAAARQALVLLAAAALEPVQAP